MLNKGTNILSEHSKNRLNFDGELKQVNFLDRRVYKRADGLYYPSVTSILQYMPKAKFFEQWIKEVGFNADIIMKKAGEEGTQVHEAIEQLLEGKELQWMDDFGNAKYSLTVWECILKFHEFWNTCKPKLIHTEQFVFSDEHKYAGTVDLIVEMDEETWLIDFKTSSSIHKSFDLQTAAYATAYTERTGKKIDKAGILWLKSTKRKSSDKKGVYQGKGWELKPVEDIQKSFDLFMLIYKLYEIENEEIVPLSDVYPTTLKL